MHRKSCSPEATSAAGSWHTNGAPGRFRSARQWLRGCRRGGGALHSAGPGGRLSVQAGDDDRAVSGRRRDRRGGARRGREAGRRLEAVGDCREPGGAGTTIGAGTVARASGDGYTLYMTTSAHTISGHIYAKLNYDPVKDFAPITLVTKVPLVLVINPAVPAGNLQEFLAYLKQKSASVNFASPGNGTAQHLSGELFKIATQSSITHVPYRGDAPAFTDLVGGQVQMMLATITSALPLIQSGKLRALAVANGTRVPALSQVPTFAEAGMPGFEAATWFGLLAPASTPAALTQRIHDDVAAIVDTPAMRKRIEDLGGEVVNSTPQAFAAFMDAEQRKWGEAVRASGMAINQQAAGTADRTYPGLTSAMFL